jgi:predicted AlkP superfamily phosphohydrolase/phosphomutase
MKARLLFLGLDGANLGFVERFVGEGVLPNIKALMEGGGLRELLPSPPCDTPTNWTSLVTGAWTGTHGITSFETHLPGTSFADRAKGSFDARLCEAERLWDLLTAEGCRCLLLDFPPSRPVTNKDVMVVGGWDTTGHEGLLPGTLRRDSPFVDFCRDNPHPESLKPVLEELRGGKDFSNLYDTQEFSSDEVLDKERQYNYYLAEVANHLFDHEGWEALFLHIHTIDNVNHTYLNRIWGDHPDFDPGAEEEGWRVFRETYRMCDEVVGRIVEHCADAGTVVCVNSDHGAVPSCKLLWPGAALSRHGLMAYRIDPQSGQYVLDVANCKAAIQFGTTEYVWANVKGREKDGTVGPGRQYEETVERIVEALSSIRDPETGQSPYSLILRKKDAAFLGQWGDRVGDVIAFAKPEYYVVDFGHHKRWRNMRAGGTEADGGLAALFALGDVSAEREYGVEGLHHGHLPTDRLGPARNSGILIMAGPQVRAGGKPACQAWTPDVAPTLTRLLGTRSLRQGEGRVLTDMISI